MKRIFFTAAIMVAAIMALTSCTGSNNGEKLTTVIHLSASQDLLDVCDIEVTYKGKGGVDIIDTVRTKIWEKTIVNDSFPTEIGMPKHRYLIKPGFKPTKEKYDLVLEYNIFTMEQYYNTGWWFLNLKDVPGDKVLSFMDVKETEIELVPEPGPGTTNCAIQVVNRVWNDSIDILPKGYFFTFEDKTY